MFESFVIENSSENPTLVLILYTVLFCFLLSSLLAFTYEKTSRGMSIPVNFLQNLILTSIVTATVMQAIGDSVARGLGMLGALSIIRFRTTLRDPRNLAFVFASIAVGIACGIYAFIIGIIGTIGFCISAFILRFTSYSRVNDLVGTLRYEVHYNSKKVEAENMIDEYCKYYILKKYKVSKKLETEITFVEYEFKVKLKRDEKGLELTEKLEAIHGIEGVRLNMQDASEDI